MLGPDFSVLIFIGTLPTLLCNIPPLPPVSLWGPLAGCVCLDEAMYTKYWRGECTVTRTVHLLSVYTLRTGLCTQQPPSSPLCFCTVSSGPAFIEAGWSNQRRFIYSVLVLRPGSTTI